MIRKAINKVMMGAPSVIPAPNKLSGMAKAPGLMTSGTTARPATDLGRAIRSAKAPGLMTSGTTARPATDLGRAIRSAKTPLAPAMPNLNIKTPLSNLARSMMKKGGKVKAKSSSSRRADGIATKGKTRGKMV